MGLQQNKHLHLFSDPWPAVPRGHGHTQTFCLCSLSLCPLKSPMLLQETACEFPEAEHAHLPGTATWNREQGFCKPVLGHRQAQARPSLWLGHLLLKHLCCVGCGGLRRRLQLPSPARRGLTAAHPHQTVPWHQMLFPGGPRISHSRPAPALPWEGEGGWTEGNGGSQKAAQIQWRGSYRHQRARGQAFVKLYGVTRADMTTDTGTGNCPVARD